ncbi:MAG: baseplate multidomain protein megatron [Hyphomicrobiaceae bacterium]
MATLALAAAGAAVGGAVLPTGVSVLGATITGATIGSQVGALAGSFIDQELFGNSGEAAATSEGPRLRDLHVTASAEGAYIPRIYGRVRLGGQAIWATDFEEEAIVTESGGGGGGKGGIGGGGSQPTSTRTDYVYYANFAVAIAEGEISALGRVWADGQELNLSDYTYRLYKGSETQQPDSLISAREGASRTPAYRGVAYIVFDRMPLQAFGNRLPQLSFEVYRSVEPFGEEIKGIVMIPGSGEFVYATKPVNRFVGLGESVAENVHTRQSNTDWDAAVDQLRSTLPNAKSVSLVVSWFGTDLRAGSCSILPGVEDAFKDNGNDQWFAGGVDRLGAYVVSQREGRPAYGGTPSDFAVVDGIRDLKQRGIKVTLAPFILMDVPDGNALANPYGGTSQPVYPWRGRITVHPAPGEPGSPDQTPLAGAQIQAFVGSAQPEHFTISGDEVHYSGPAEWSYRRMVLHQAHLAKAAGGVDAFLIGTELRGLTWVRDGIGSYPFVQDLIQLAGDVKQVLGSGTEVTYAADWSEYFGHQPADGSGDVYFHLDPLWASSNIDAVGIDCYWPLADWRDGRAHLDYQSGARSVHDLEYLTPQVMAGEGYDWYYANQSDRDAQLRTPITDGQGKPWVFRYKDVQSWWANAHYDRPGGVENAVATPWVPESKPIWFMEIGSPAVDKGANQPNVFVDPKSSENFLPYYSRGSRDDLMQRRYLQAMIRAFDPSAETYVPGANPISSVYGGHMLPLDKVFVYCWDARPYPAFPYNLDAWGDGENWRLGHWLTGRFSGAPLADVVAKILEESNFEDFNVGGLFGTVPGYVIDRVMSPRNALVSLGLAYFFDALESGGQIVFRHRGHEPSLLELEHDDFVETGAQDALCVLTRGQETDLPATAKVSYISSLTDYQQAISESRRLVGASGRVSQAQLPIVLEGEQAAQIADTWLFETWTARERIQFALPPSQLAIEPGDVVTITHGGREVDVRITEVADRGVRQIEGRSIDRDVYDAPPALERPPRAQSEIAIGPAEGVFLDLPLLRGTEVAEAGYFAATRTPWPGGIALYSSPIVSGYALRGIATREAVIGETLNELTPGPVGRYDFATRLQVQVSGQLSSQLESQVLSGSNAACVRNSSGGWEVFQFLSAELIATDVYELSALLRGQAGTEAEMLDGINPGATFILLDGAVAEIDVTSNDLRLPLNWRYGPAGRDIGDASYVDIVHAYQGVGLRPFSPVHPRAIRTNDDIALSWIRRTRVGGDSWETVEVPLGEDEERYEVDVLDGDVPVRVLSVTSPNASYTAQQQVEDFGVPQSSVSVRIYQLSSTWGRGAAAEVTV